MKNSSKKAFRILSFFSGAACLIILMLYMSGAFIPDKIEPEAPVSKPEHRFIPKKITKASIQTMTEVFEAVGTVRPRTETRVEAQITARIVDIFVSPGDIFTKRKLLIVLDNRQFQAKLDQTRQGLQSAISRREQARQGVLEAEAAYDQAESAFKRTKIYFESEAATNHDLEIAEAAYLRSKARVQQSKDVLRETASSVMQSEKIVEEARIALGYTKITAREAGEVARRLAEPGDMAWPGKPLLVLQTRGSLRLEALIREGLIQRVKPGNRLKVFIGAIDRPLIGTVEEVVPSADPSTRTFLAKVGLPPEKDIYPGMFGRLLVPSGVRRVVVIPKAAITRVGQLETVIVKLNGDWQQIFVKTGREIGENVEVLSGLDGDETLALRGEE